MVDALDCCHRVIKRYSGLKRLALEIEQGGLFGLLVVEHQS